MKTLHRSSGVLQKIHLAHGRWLRLFKQKAPPIESRARAFWSIRMAEL
jgi:hypothetical protein